MQPDRRATARHGRPGSPEAAAGGGGRHRPRSKGLCGGHAAHAHPGTAVGPGNSVPA